MEIPDFMLWTTDFASWTGLNLHSFMEAIFIIITCLVLAATTVIQYRNSAPAVAPANSVLVTPTPTPAVGGKRRRLRKR